MKKIVFILSLLFLHNYFCVGQTQSDTGRNKIEGIKETYMNKELNLTPEEAQKFWPVYNNYFKEIRQARKSYQNDEVAFEEKKVQIRKKYQGQFKSVLNSDNRVNRVFVSEKNLRDLFKKELQDRQRRRKLIGTQPQKSPKTNVKPPRKVN